MYSNTSNRFTEFIDKLCNLYNTSISTYTAHIGMVLSDDVYPYFN